MKKIGLAGIIFLLSLSLIGCSTEANANKHKITPIPEETELKLSEAVAKSIKQHNHSVKLDDRFPQRMKDGESITKEVSIGGIQGNTAKVDFSVVVKKAGSRYVVTLTKNYNLSVNGTNAMSFWKYEASTNKVELLEKREDDNLVNIIK